MEFRYPTASAEANMNAMKYLTQNMSVPEKGREEVHDRRSEPQWFPRKL